MKKILLLFFLSVLNNLFSQNIEFQLYKKGFNQPVGIVFDSDGNGYVWEKGGIVKKIGPDGGDVEQILDISNEVMNVDDHGLLGFALDPDFIDNGYIYLWYTVEPATLFSGVQEYDKFSATIGRCVRYTYKNGVTHSRKVLIGNTLQDGPPILGTTHGVGTVFFGADKKLLLSVGDGSLGDQEGARGVTRGVLPQAEQSLIQMRAQSNTSLSGKILRIDKETGDGLPTNPYYDVSNPRSAQSRIIVKGLRNPYRVTALTQNVLGNGPGQFLVSDTGENAWEELALYSSGDNGGWPHYEGFDVARINEQQVTFAKDPGATFKNPLYSWAHPNNAQKGWGTDSKVSVHGQAVLVNTLSGSYNHTGTSSTANTFYPKNIITDRYAGLLSNTVLVGDYTQPRLMGIKFEENNSIPDFSHPNKVYKISESAEAVVQLYTNPYDGYIYTINYKGQNPEISRLVLATGNNSSPTAKINSNKTHITQNDNIIQFYGDSSYGAETANLSYSWNFGDGEGSNDMNPQHTYTLSGSNPDKKTVTLTVTDVGGAANTITKDIFINNSAPVIQDIKVENGQGNIIQELALPSSGLPNSIAAKVSISAIDDLTNADNLVYSIQVNRHHDTHMHPGPLMMGMWANIDLLPEGGCGEGATYWFEILVKVKDAQGAESEQTKQIFQVCSGLKTQTISVLNPPISVSKNLPFYNLTASASSGLAVSYGRIDGPINIDSNGKITFTGGLGPARVVLLQAGNTIYGNAKPVYVDFEVNNRVAPVANFDNIPKELCINKNIIVTNTSTGGATNTYSWKLIEGNAYQPILTGTGQNFEFTMPNHLANWYQIELTATNSLGTSTKSSSWIEKKECGTPALVANFTAPNELCADKNIIVTNTSTGGTANTYSWKLIEKNTSQTIYTGTGQNFEFTMPNHPATWYKIELTVTNSQGSSTKSSDWIEKKECGVSAPIANFNMSIELCTNKNIIVTNTSTGGAANTYSWKLIEGNAYQTIYTGTGQNFEFTMPNYSATWYKIELTVTNSQGSSTKSSGWIQKKECGITPVANFDNIPTELCVNKNIMVTNTSTGGATNTYQWELIGGNHQPFYTSTSPNFEFTMSNYSETWYYIKLTVTNSQGTSTKSSGWIQKKECGITPVANFDNIPTELCVNKNIMVTNTSTGGATNTYQWELIGGNHQPFYTSTSPNFEFTMSNYSETWYYIKLTVTNSQGTSTKSSGWIQKKECGITPVANFDNIPTELCVNKNIMVTNTSTGGATNTYQWELIGGNHQPFYTSTSPNFEFTMSNYSETWYYIKLTVTNSQGSSTKSSNWIQKTECLLSRVSFKENSKVNSKEIKPLAEKEDNLVYPNPSSSIIKFSDIIIKNYTDYVIYDSSYIREIKKGLVKDKAIDISKFENGIYNILFINSITNDKINKRIIKR
ncbi:PKD domain-containing protein [Chryseobacterium sp.]|uniref:PKD domain-containing protein n=1 Tax=Chryseobacterium sp. TaxID=1871047 RepID=UPI002FC7C51D